MRKPLAFESAPGSGFRPEKTASSRRISSGGAAGSNAWRLHTATGSPVTASFRSFPVSNIPRRESSLAPMRIRTGHTRRCSSVFRRARANSSVKK